MLKKKVKYIDFNGVEVEEFLYFNLTTTELIDIEVQLEDVGGLSGQIERIIAAEKASDIIDTFKKIMKWSYGVKSDDGKRFMKSDAIWEEFTQTAAYDQIFSSLALATDADAAAEFINGIVPADLLAKAEALKAAQDAQKTETDRQAESVGITLPPPAQPFPTTGPPPYSGKADANL